MEKIMKKLDVDEMMNFKLDEGIHIYPLIRYFILSTISFKDEVISPSSIGKYTKILNLFKGLSQIRFKKSKIIFMTSTLFNIKQENKFINVLDDYYSDVFPSDSYIFEHLDAASFSTIPKKNRLNCRVSTLPSYLEIIITLLSKFTRTKKSDDIENFIDFLRVNKIDKDTIAIVRTRLYRFKKEYMLAKIVYSKFLKLTSAKLLFVNCASYGWKNAILIDEAKKLGIIVAEIQHGSISKSHLAYNFAHNPKGYDWYLPDYLLTFGDYYNDIALKTIKVPVGHPHLDRKKEILMRTCKVVKNSYLFISQWPVAEELVSLAEELAIIDPLCTINYRLHPQDNLTNKQLEQLNKKNIKITKSFSGKDLYAEIVEHEKIVGCYSTGLLEASAFDKPIYVLKHKISIEEGFDKVGIMIENAYDIMSCNKEKIITEKFFVDGFKKRYKNFIGKNFS